MYMNIYSHTRLTVKLDTDLILNMALHSCVISTDPVLWRKGIWCERRIYPTATACMQFFLNFWQLVEGE